MKRKNNPDKVLDTLINSKRPLCIIDSRFDYDAFSSALSLAIVMKDNFNTKLCLVWSKDVPDAAKELLDTSDIEEGFKYSQENMGQYDLLISLDSGDKPHILGKNFKLPDGVLHLNIDHHESNDGYGDVNYVDATSVSTCRILYELFKEWNLQISNDAKKALMLGIITDSGFFQFQKTNAKDFRAMAELLDSGIDMYELIWKLTFNDRYENMLEKAIVYGNLVANFEEKYAYSFITLKDLEKRGLTTLHGLIPASDIIKRLKGVDYIFVVKEKEDEPGKFKASLRSHKIGYDVSKIASALGGGGHAPAASTGWLDNVSSVEETVNLIISTAETI